MRPRLGKDVWASPGLTLIELLVVVVILGVLGGIATVSLRSLWQGQILTANLDVVRSWLEATRRAALRGESCEVVFTSGLTKDRADIIESKKFGGINQSCNNPKLVQLESPDQKRSYNFNVTSGSAISSFFFTPRGTIFNPASNGPTFSNDIIISLELASSSGAKTSDKYCLRVSPLMGNISQPSKSNC